MGAIENCRLAPIIYPGWKVRIYIDSSIDHDLAKRLHDMGAEIFLIQNVRGPYHGMYWRFLVNDDPNVNQYIIRDLDSRLNWREREAVEEWIKSSFDFHIMRDHKNHTFPIQGGMWGCRNNLIPNIQLLINQWNQYDKYGCDQFFLSNIIYPLVKEKSMVHDEYFEKKPFPKHKPIDDGSWFVGQIFDEHGVPQKE
jgi:hypothetical protein